MLDCMPLEVNRSVFYMYSTCMCRVHVIILYKIVHTGDIKISRDITRTVDSGGSPQFTLTCISTGGPATTVTWTRDSVTVTEGTETVLDDPEDAEYTHTLTVSGTPDGIYNCTVSNDKPSKGSASVDLRGMLLPSLY